MAYQCWIGNCGKEFDSRRKLKDHMQPAPHRALQVVCPFCFHQEVSYNRATDLKAHCLKRHADRVRDINIRPEELLSENNVFWCAYKPADYQVLVDPTPRSSKPATRLRTQLLEWAKTTKFTPSRSREEWLDGWDSRPAIKLTRVSAGQNTSTSTIQSSLQIHVRGYSPSNPGLTIGQLRHLALVPGNIKAVVQEENQYFFTTLSDSVLLDPKAMASLTRKLAVIEMEPDLPHASQPLPESQFASVRSMLSRVLGVDNQFIMKISTAATDSTIFSPVTPHHLDMPDLSSSSPLQSHPPASEPVLDLFPESSSELDTPTASPQKSSKPVFKRRASKPDLHLGKQKKAKPSSPEPAVPAPDKAATEPAPITSAHLPSLSCLQDNSAGSLQERARNLIARGCMPILPPARREWSKDEAVTFSVGSMKISWPPKDWKKMSKDQKLLQFEFLAMTIMTSGGHPVIERADLLDHCNFLALPGTPIFPIKKTDSALLKSRIYTYRTVCEIANGENCCEPYLLLLEQACAKRDTKLDNYIATIDAAGIPLRLVKDE